MPGTISTCGCFTTVDAYYSGTYLCADVESDYTLTATQLTTWNPWLASNCDSNLYAGMAASDTRPVCIGVNATATTTTTPTPSSTSVSMGPTATGEVAGCQQFYTVQPGDSCSSIETAYAISFAQFYAWNPSIDANCQTLILGYAYCVLAPSPSSTSSSSSSSTTTTSISPPASTQSGIAPNCNAYYTVVAGDSCAAIETQFGDTFAQLYAWNPAIGSNCQSLFVGYVVCVGVAS